MLRVTYLDFHEKSGSTQLSGWYITDANGAMLNGGHRFEDQASGMRALAALLD